MINANQIELVSDRVQQKAVGGRVVRKSATEFLFIPADKSKARRIINFLSSGRVLCVDTDGEYCKANEFHRACYHVTRIALFIIRSERLKELKQVRGAA